MKKYLIYTGYAFGGILLLLYISFLFILPNKINLENYKKDIQSVVKENSDLNIDYGKIKIITTPLLEAGIKAQDIVVTLPDGSKLFETKELKGKVFLPSLLWLSVRVTDASVDSPQIHIDIENSQQYKVAKVYENFVNRRRQDKLNHPEKYENENNELPIDLSKIKFFVNSFVIKNFIAKIDDVKANHNIKISGEKVNISYNNGKSAKIKTLSKLYFDDKENIVANIDIDSFLPEFIPSQKQAEDNEEVYSIPFINPVKAYSDYDLKSNIESKLKIRQDEKCKKIITKGFLNVDNTTVKLSGLQLPESYFHLIGKGFTTEIDTNLFVTEKEYINIFGKINHSEKPSIDISIKSPQVYFNNLLKLTKAYLDTIHIKNNIANMSASGYFMSNARIKTDFKKLKSKGNIIIRNASLSDSLIGFLANNINANFAFMDDTLKITDTRATINGQPLYISGKIDTESIIDLNVQGNKIPLMAFYYAFAPKELKNNYKLASGTLSIDAKVNGELKDSSSIIKTQVDDLTIHDVSGNFILKNKNAHINLAYLSGKIMGRFVNSGLNLSLPNQNSIIKDEKTIVNIDNNSITLNPSDIIFNNNSKITINGKIKNYLSNPETNIIANGGIDVTDIETFIGKETSAYLDKKGKLPVYAQMTAKGKKAKLYSQLIADSQNYITPVHINELFGKQTIFQLRAEKNKDVLKLNKTGIYTRPSGYQYKENLYRNLVNAKDIISVKAIVSNLNTEPFINLLKIRVPHHLNGSICIFPKSSFDLDSRLFAYGQPNKMNLNGNISIKNLIIPEIMTRIHNMTANIGSKNLNVVISGVNANGSDFRIIANSPWEMIANSIIRNVEINSRYIDINKLLKVVENLNKNLPVTENKSNKPSQIPVEINSGSISLNRIVMDKIFVNNTTGKIFLKNSILFLHNLKTFPLDGEVGGNASMNLLNNELKAKVHGKNFDVEKVLLDVMNMKDTLSGNMNFIADISMKGTELQEQMKTLAGFVDFNIKEGQLGPFGKFENFLMAENIRENAFFSSTIGSVITNIVTIDTSRYNELYGHLTFKDGIANISPIKSQGNVMSLFILGDLNLLDNTADMKLRGKLASAFSDSLGPLSNINPVNLVKNTPGLNIVAAKTFSVFCEAVSEEEMNALPDLGKGKTDENATKFQIKLKGDTRRPLKMIKSFKWLALNSEIESAQNFVDTLPIPEAGEENLSVEELMELRQQQAMENPKKKKNQKKSIINKLFNKKNKKDKE